MGDLAGAGTRVMLVATASQAAGSVLPDLPAVRTTGEDLARALTERCGLGPAQITQVTDPENPIVFANALRECASQAGDVFLLWYAGHGQVDGEGNLYLATRATVDVSRGLAAYQALPFSQIHELLREHCPARTVVLVIDACYAGRAGDRGLGSGGAGVNLDDGGGAGRRFLLTSAARDEHAIAPPGSRHTAFTGALLTLLRDGDVHGGPDLTLDHIARALARSLPERGFPGPRWWSSHDAGGLIVAGNPAYQPPDLFGEPAAGAGAGRRGVEGAGAAPRADDRDLVCPYPGLTAFGRADANLFHGRDDLVARLVKLTVTRFGAGPLLVVGPSGSGKSSLVRAGLLPALARGDAGGGASAHWPQITISPGPDPLGTLAERLAGPLATEPAELTECWRADPEGLADSLCAVLTGDPTPLGPGSPGAREPGPAEEARRVVLVVDQFEELFTLCADADDRDLFARALAAASTNRAASGDRTRSEPPAVVVLLPRSDFLPACATHPALADSLQRGPVVVGPMSREELREAIEGPARDTGLVLQPGLVEILLADVGAVGAGARDVGKLPMLAHALLETWLRRDGRALTIEGYRATGGIEAAISRRAEAVYSDLDDNGRREARAILVRLVHADDYTRRRVGKAVLLAGAADPAAAAAALDQFTAARLVTLGHDPAGAAAMGGPDSAGPATVPGTGTAGSAPGPPAGVSGDTVEIVHEALPRAWPRLRDWIDADRDLSLISEEIEADARRWAEARDAEPSRRAWPARPAGHAPGQAPGQAPAHRLVWPPRRSGGSSRELLYRGGRLAGARQRLAGRQLSDPVAVAFMSASVAARRRAVRLRRGAVAALVALLAVAVALAGVTWNLRHVALNHNREAVNRGLLSQAAARRDIDPRGALQRAIAAYRIAPDSVARASIVSTLNSTAITATLTGARGPVRAVTFAPGGRLLAEASYDGTVALWDASGPAGPRRLGTLTAGGRGVTSLAFTPDGRTLATAGSDGTASLWDVARPQAPRRLGRPLAGPGLPGHPVGSVYSVAVSPDGRTLAAGTDGGSVLLWDIADRGVPRSLRPGPTGYRGPVRTVAFSPDGQTLATGADHDVILWDLADRAAPRPLGPPLAGHREVVNTLAFAPGGRVLATGSDDGTVILWNVGERAAPRPFGPPLTGQKDVVYALAFAPDGRFLATGSGDRTVLLWNVSDPGAPRRLGSPLVGHLDAVRALAFAPGGRTLASGSDDRTAILWDVGGGAAPRRISPALTGQNSQVRALAFAPGGHLLVSGGDDGRLVAWDIVAGTPRPLGAAAGALGPVRAVAFSPQGRLLASTSYTGRVVLWDAAGGGVPRPVGRYLGGHTGPVYAAAFSPAGPTLATGGNDKTVILWDVSRPAAPRRISRILTGHEGSVLALAFSPDGRTLATASYDNTVRVWDVADRAAPRRIGAPLTGHQGSVRALAFSRDGRTLATASADGTAILWDTTSGADGGSWRRLGWPLIDHEYPLLAVAFSPTGPTLATGGDDGTVMLWDVADRAAASPLGRPLPAHTGPVRAVAFSPDSRILATGSADTTVILWDPGRLSTQRAGVLERACQVVGAGLSRQDWAVYARNVPYRRTCP